MTYQHLHTLRHWVSWWKHAWSLGFMIWSLFWDTIHATLSDMVPYCQLWKWLLASVRIISHSVHGTRTRHMKGCVYNPFCSHIFPCLWTLWFNPISLFALFITFGEFFALVRIYLVFLVICQLLMNWIELWCHDFLLKKWCFKFNTLLLPGCRMNELWKLDKLYLSLKL